MTLRRRGRVLLYWFSLANRMAIQIGMNHTNKSPEFPGRFSGTGRDSGDKTLVELPEYFDVHANKITQWEYQLLERISDVIDASLGMGCFISFVSCSALALN